MIILHLLPTFNPIFTCVDPNPPSQKGIQMAPEYGSNTDPDPQHCFLRKFVR